MGCDTTVTAGGVYELLRDAHELVPGITELELADVVAGLRPGSPDNAPLLGPTALPGLLLATGHHRNGVLLTPSPATSWPSVATGDCRRARSVRPRASAPEPARSSPMNVTVNGAAHEVPDGATVAQAVRP